MTCISLSRQVIEKILNKCGYKNYYRLFLSSEIGFKKEDGNLFRFVRNELCLQRWSLSHFGDNLKSDYLMAVINGFVPRHIDKYCRSNDCDDITSNVISNLIQIHKLGNCEEMIGYSKFGPFLQGYLFWLHSNLPRLINLKYIIKGIMVGFRMENKSPKF